MALKPKDLHPKNNQTKFELFLLNFFNGKPPKLTGKAAETGTKKAATSRKINTRIKEIAENATTFKIGAMGDTWVRMEQNDYRGNFDFVQRVFVSQNEQRIIDLEVDLIRKFKKLYPDKILNISETKANRLTSYDGKYYIYVVYT